MNRYAVNVNGRELEVRLLGRTASQLSFEINGINYEVDIRAILGKPSAASDAYSAVAASQSALASATRTHSAGTVVAPMPGIVVKVNVEEGQTIEFGETVLVIEAMKMENNIPAGKSGKIQKVHVKEGSEVQNAQLLVTID